ncbi:MAG: hypothetical protein KKD18_07055 [Nanoarchaeota archaeon]|nr:hypothetical protein [Nanoarchaeota archaeon]MBU0978150.1 hypothetical protein [Nanoarchaeota archaeon]
MVEDKTRAMLIGVFAALAILSLGYIFEFSDRSPADMGPGIQFGPTEDGACREICSENNVFMGCERDYGNPVCGVSCRGVIGRGPRMGEPASPGKTTCQFTECVCVQ